MSRRPSPLWTPWAATPTLLTLVALAAAGCQPTTPDSGPPLTVTTFPLAAACTAQVDGTGAVDTETDYLPHVVSCENGGADYEALKAQAVAARSVLYYAMARNGSIGDGQGAQVYTCNRPPRQVHYDAVAETAGEVLLYRDTQVYAFYVAGAIPTAADCVARDGDSDAYNTERYVTYNQGRSGGDVIQTPLGWVDPSNDANRGCKSQNGANCLSQKGWGYVDILKFYYGTDFQLVVADGDCVEPQDCVPEVGGAETVVDDRDSCFVRGACGSWHEESVGHDGHLHWTYAWDREADCTARWRLSFAEAGDYAVDVWVADFGDRSASVPYSVRHAGQVEEVPLSQAASSGWRELGVFAFSAGGDQWVALSDATGEPYADRKQILVDAVRVRRFVDEPDCREDADCSDQDACNGQERCVEGECVRGEAPRCVDGEECTLDTCEPAVGCVPVDRPDGWPCGVDGACYDGRCVAGARNAGVEEPDLTVGEPDLPVEPPDSGSGAPDEGAPEADLGTGGAADTGLPGSGGGVGAGRGEESVRGGSCGVASGVDPGLPGLLASVVGVLLLALRRTRRSPT